MLITSDTYTAHTGEAVADESAFEEDQATVIERIESALGRGLEARERTEPCIVYSDGWAYPDTTPVISASDDQGELDVEHGRVQTYVRGSGEHVPVTYVGGWTTETCPSPIREAVAWAIHTKRNPQQSTGTVPAGVASLSIAGEYSVTFKDGAPLMGADNRPVPGALNTIADLGGRACDLLMRYLPRGRTA